MKIYFTKNTRLSACIVMIMMITHSVNAISSSTCQGVRLYFPAGDSIDPCNVIPDDYCKYAWWSDEPGTADVTNYQCQGVRLAKGDSKVCTSIVSGRGEYDGPFDGYDTEQCEAPDWADCAFGSEVNSTTGLVGSIMCCWCGADAALNHTNSNYECRGDDGNTFNLDNFARKACTAQKDSECINDAGSTAETTKTSTGWGASDNIDVSGLAVSSCLFSNNLQASTTTCSTLIPCPDEALDSGECDLDSSCTDSYSTICNLPTMIDPWTGEEITTDMLNNNWSSYDGETSCDNNLAPLSQGR